MTAGFFLRVTPFAKGIAISYQKTEAVASEFFNNRFEFFRRILILIVGP